MGCGGVGHSQRKASAEEGWVRLNSRQCKGWLICSPGFGDDYILYSQHSLRFKRTHGKRQTLGLSTMRCLIHKRPGKSDQKGYRCPRFYHGEQLVWGCKQRTAQRAITAP